MHGVPSRVATLLTAALLAAWAPTQARAATPAPGIEPAGETPLGPQPPRRPIPLAFTVAGGVSLGAYEAGMLHYMVELMKANPGLREPRLVTGASAGSVNGLITILSACSPDARPVAPEEGAFWSTWVPLGFDQLWSRQHPGGPVGAFNRHWLRGVAERLRARWNAGLDARCDVVLGVSVTRVVPRSGSRLAGGLSIPHVDEKFTLRIRGRGPGRPPSLVNYVDPTWPGEKVLLPEGPGGEVPYESLRDLIFASSAFPVAYAPQPLRHCVFAAGGGTAPRCPPGLAEEALFVDGGILDNTPLRLAARLAAGGLRDDGTGGTRWLDSPRLGDWAAPPRLLFVYVSPDASSYPPPEEREPERAPPSVARLVRELVGGVIGTARSKNLSAIFEEYPLIAERIVLPLRREPAAGAPMHAFLGFFEEEFRRYDFTLGMYHVRRMVEESVLPSMRRIDPAATLALPDESGAPGWGRLACLRGLLDGRETPLSSCADPSFGGLRILAQSSLFRLWDDCSPSPTSRAGAPPPADPRCLAAWRGEPPPLLLGVEGADRVEWRRRSGEDELVHVTRLLAALHFWWRDTGLAPDDGGEAIAQIRQRLGEVIGALALAQPTAEDRFLVGAVGDLVANGLAYQAPFGIAHLAFGRDVELGVSLALSNQRHPTVRLHAALELHGAYSALSSDGAPFAPAGLVGLEFRPRQMSSALFQPFAILRGGWVVAPAHRRGRQGCDVASRDPASCTRPVVEAGFALSVLGALRGQLLLESYPSSRSGQRTLWALAPSLGVQVPF